MKQKLSLAHIAVETEGLKPRRKLPSNQPPVNVPVEIPTVSFAVSRSIVGDVVDGQEVRLVLATAGTRGTIVSENLVPIFCVCLATIGRDFFSVFSIADFLAKSLFFAPAWLTGARVVAPRY